MTRREEIVVSLKEYLKTLESDSFFKDVVFYEWQVDLDDTMLPALVIFDKKDNIEQELSSSLLHTLNITIELHSTGNSAKPTNIRENIQKILNVLREFNSISLVEIVRVKEIDIEVQNQNSSYGVGILDFEVGYYSDEFEI